MDNIKYPKFLKLLDSNPNKAFEDFYRFAYQVLTTVPPRPMRNLNHDDRMDLVHDIVYHCTKNDFRVLRTYQDKGKPFACWLYKVAHNVVLEYYRKEGKKWHIVNKTSFSDGLQSVGEFFSDFSNDERKKQELMELISKVRRALEEVGRKCRLLLELAADEYSLVDIAKILQIRDNKKVSDDLRYCRNKLKSLLVTRGVILQEYI